MALSLLVRDECGYMDLCGNKSIKLEDVTPRR